MIAGAYIAVGAALIVADHKRRQDSQCDAVEKKVNTLIAKYTEKEKGME